MNLGQRGVVAVRKESVVQKGRIEEPDSHWRESWVLPIERYPFQIDNAYIRLVLNNAIIRAVTSSGNFMENVKYRLNDPRLAPRRTKLEIPGWAGKRESRADGSREQVWHCVPFSEGAQYGIELFYPYDFELHVSTKDGSLIFSADWGEPPDGGVNWPPFRNFGDTFYTYQILLDLKVEKGMAIRTEPHPRFYSDRSDTVPIAVPALVRNWWPMLFFTVFKAPAEGRTHIFRPNEPFAQIIVIPEEANFELEKMSEEESAERELQARRIYTSRPTLSAGTEWTSSTNTVFDGTYRHLHRAAKEKGRQS
jgi:hypothetical protein